MKKTMYSIALIVLSSTVWAQQKTGRAAKADSAVVTRQVNKTPERTTAYGMEAMRSMGEMAGAGSADPYKMVNAFDMRYEGVKGNPYLIGDWAKGRLLFTNNEWSQEVDLKFDCYNQEVRYKRPQGDSLIVYPSQLRGFQINDQVSGTQFNFFKVEQMPVVGGDEFNGFLSVVYRGKVSLLKHFKKRLNPADYKGAMNMTNRRYDTFEDESTLFLRNQEEKLVRIKLNRKSVLYALRDREDEIKKFMEETGNRCKTEKEVIDVLRRYEIGL
jgi:hypothetical protein